MRLIDADEFRVFLDRQYHNCHGYMGNKKEIYREALRAVKSYVHNKGQIDAVEGVHGHWITHNPNNPFTIYGECSECGFKPDSMRDKFNYCPNCGAKMDEVSE